ncbi:surface antigen (D15) [Mucilaginibacter paludis DSM 18603]|uniref:Surface antigen (D15) n=1 Tax=Mucilaginibacter paludis DSM 18603 TaxID=714943 RepID=H1Y5C6_9SPHI|nr:surface antigen (D15) [Mucilaginibacter paludis DSM 18603]
MRTITLKGIDKQYSLVALNYVDKEQQPNNWLNLQLYYLLSKHGKRDIGEAPRILDSNLVEFSRLQIERFLQNKGFVKAKVDYAIKIKKRKAELIFTANEGPLFRIRKFQDSIQDVKVRNLYREKRKDFSHVQPGKAFDLDSLAYDRDQIFQMMKRNGYYDFYRQYITYDYDTVFNSSVADIKMIIANPPGKKEHAQFTINNTLITIFRSNGRTYNRADSIKMVAQHKIPGKADTLQVDSEFRFVDYSNKFKPKAVVGYIFQHKGDMYNIDRQNLTTTRLSELNVFRNVPNPSYVKTADSTNRLDSKIDIIPLKHMTDRVEGEFIFNGGRSGFNVGNTFTDRNLFKGAEILQLKLNWSVLFDNSTGAIGSSAIQNQDVRIGLNLIYPRIISPFNFPMPGQYGVPHTTFSSTYQLYFQKGLVSRKSLINSLTYDWAETSQKLHTLTPFNIEFSEGIIDPGAKSQLIDQDRYSYVYLIGRKIFTSGSQYTYQVNANKLFTYGTFTYFRGTVDVGGNTLSLLTKLLNTPRDTLGQHTLFGQTFAQYSKFETDFRFYKNLGGERMLVFRFSPGIGIPYGNSSQLIFEKNFYGGGANDIRAWLPRTLGPGQFNRAVYGPADSLKSQTLRDRLKYLDQFGEIKIVGNIEYRYPLVANFFGSKLNGAIFTDFGNVWRLKPETDSPNGTFNVNNIFQSTAIGVGTGLRFDLGFFVFRLDAAFKFKDPQFNGSDQWVFTKHFNELFRAGPFKHTYEQTNGESYNFMQLNFGIGLPF